MMERLRVGIVLGCLVCAAVIPAARIGGTAQIGPRAPAAWAPFVEPDFPFFSSVLDARALGPGWPADNLTPRGLILNLGHDAWACFDTDLLRVSALWTGGAVTPVSMSQGSYELFGEKAPEGQGTLPRIAGTPWVANGLYPGWQTNEPLRLIDPRAPGPDPKEVGRGPIDPALGRFKAVRLTNTGVRLDYEVAGASVHESIAARVERGQVMIDRRIHMEGLTRTVVLAIGRRPDTVGAIGFVVSSTSSEGQPAAIRADQPGGVLAVRVRPGAEPIEFQATLSSSGLPTARTAMPPTSSDSPAAARWPQSVVTAGALSTTNEAFVVDRIALPTTNPWRRNVRLADLAFFNDGRAAAVTFDGDVWMITGLRGDLKEIRWRRFASGLHEPLGLALRGGDLFVFDRNGIWRLRDTDGNGEADVHELFSNVFAQTAETREFATGLRVAPDGSFVIAKGGQVGTTVGKHNGSILRISPDGRSMTTVAYGLRQPFVAIHPKTGLVTATDQQGNYVPATPLHIVGEGRYYGFIPLVLPKEQYPAPIADPLVWIPHAINASAASQTWLTGARMGPLTDALIHIGYYRPELFLVLFNRRAPRVQASVVSLTRQFEFAPLEGALNPVDGQLYLTGFQIWGTEAKDISGLARYRYTGAPSTLPREFAAMERGILLRFDVALDRRSAAGPNNYSS